MTQVKARTAHKRYRRAMSMMTVRAVNAAFESSDTRDFDSADDAYRAAIATGVEIAAAEILSGAPSCVVELAVAIEGSGIVRRGAIAMSLARLKLESPAEE